MGIDLCASQPNTQCANTEGNFSCECVPGYVTVEGQCMRECLFYDAHKGNDMKLINVPHHMTV